MRRFVMSLYQKEKIKTVFKHTKHPPKIEEILPKTEENLYLD